MQTRVRDLDRYWKTIQCPTHKGYYQSHTKDCETCHQVHNLHAMVGAARTKLRVIEYLGGKCRRCGVSDPRVLVVNHIKGKKDPREVGSALYSGIASGKFPLKGLELLCSNCNLLYEYERGNSRGLTKYREYLSV